MVDKLTPEETLRGLQELLGRPDPVGFRRAGVPPPAPHYITRDDRLFVRVFNSLPNVVVHAKGRIMLPGGDVVPFDYSLTPTTVRASNLSRFDIPEGFLLGLTVWAEVATPRRGHTFVQVGFSRGGQIGNEFVQLLISDYVTANCVLGWPGGPLRSSVEGPGVLRSFGGVNPAAGSEISVPVPTNARWLFHAGVVQFVTSVVVANRRTHLIIDDGATVLFRSIAGDVQAASLTHNYNIGNHGFTAAVADGEQRIPIPDNLLLFQGWRIRTETDNIDAGDDYGRPAFFIEEWIEE